MMFLMGKRISSIVIVFSWMSNFTPRLCIACLPIMRSYIGAWSPRPYSTMSSWRRTLLLTKYSTQKISMLPTLSVMKVPLEVPHDWGTTRFTTVMCLLDPFFMKRRSPLDPESSRTLIVLFLTYSPELMLRSGFLAQSEHVFLLFSSKLVRFSSHLAFSQFLRKVSWCAGIFRRNIGSFRLLVRRPLISEISAPQFASFFTKNAHCRNYGSHLSGFCSFVTISSAFVVSLRAVLTTFIGWGLWDE